MLLVDGGRVTGVRLPDGTAVRAPEVVLAAGAVGTPHLLLRSGIGPADELRAAGLAVRLDRAGVGRAFTDHPAVFLPFTTDDPPPHPHAPAAQAALDLDAGADPAGDVQILLFARPFTPGGPLHLMCQLTRPDSRGRLTLPDAAGPPRIAFRYLRTEHDRRRLRHAVRTAAELLRAGLGTRVEPGGDVLGSDRALDGWIATHLDTAQHLGGTAPMGPPDDPHAVVDPVLRVHGLAGLRIADLSVLPAAPRRGTAATACAVGEAAAEFLGAEFPVAGSAGTGPAGARTRQCPGRATRRGRMVFMTDGAAALLARFGAPDACAARLLCDNHPPGDLAFTIAEPDLTARDLTFGELEAESAAFAAALADLGIGPGDRVGVLMEPVDRAPRDAARDLAPGCGARAAVDRPGSPGDRAAAAGGGGPTRGRRRRPPHQARRG